ncbi:uncharacterized protein EAF02_007081 [Botrytis sinoallii]|uniref:uncharacterized protein n=1 Tax=Botrytis sinoallii TaxID=1463999 RepID=UPI0019003F3E|nr:uncharacterized protein EAF02_007081 [Botrytis sinoallii]KAF7881190.1 hypothetical protein EAF02_007081 [Botrytis sinoallii]
MTTTPVGRTAKPTPSLDTTRSNSNANAKTTRNSKSNAFTSSAIRNSRNDAESMSNSTPTPKPKTNASLVTKSTPETQKPIPKPTYPKPLVIWHIKPSKKIWLTKRNRKRSSNPTNSKKDTESTTNPTPILKQKANTSSAGRNAQPRSSPENKKSIPNAKLTRNSGLNGERSSKIATSKKDAEALAPVTAGRMIIEISDSDDDDDTDGDIDEDVDDTDGDGDVYVDEDDDIDEDGDGDVYVDDDIDGDEVGDVDVDEDVDRNEDNGANTTPQSIPMRSLTLDATPDMVFIPNINAAPASPHLGDLDPMPWMSEVEAVPASGLENPLAGDGDGIVDADANANATPQSIPMYSSTLDTTPNIMGLIPDFTAGLGSPYLGDLMPWVSETEPGPALALDPGLENSTLEATSNIMGLIPNANATTASLYRGNLMLSGSEAELELPSGLGNQVAGDEVLLSDDMYMNTDSHLDSHMDMDINMNVDTEINTSPFQTSWEGMYMNPPLTAEEKGWDFSSVGIEEIDGLFEEMEKEMSGDMDVEMEMGSRGCGC